MTVARLQWVIVGVMRTVTVRRGESGEEGRVLEMKISGRLTTAREARERGCSGSWMVEMRSVGGVSSDYSHHLYTWLSYLISFSPYISCSSMGSSTESSS